jgi:hypothetical protein
MKGYIYLIQPENLFGTLKYMILWSNKSRMEQLFIESKTTRILCLFPAEGDASKLWKNVIKKCRATYPVVDKEKKLFKVDNEKKFVSLFLSSCMLFSNLIEKEEKSNQDFEDDDSVTEDEEELDEKISQNEIRVGNKKIMKNAFPNWLEDESFGGTKKLIKFRIRPNFKDSKSYFVDFLYINNWKLEKFEYEHDSNYDHEYFTKKIMRHIKENQIFDLNDYSLIQKFLRTKTNINVFETSSSFSLLNIDDDTPNNLIRYLFCDTVINSKIYCQLNEKSPTSFIAKFINIELSMLKFNYDYVLKNDLDNYLPYYSIYSCGKFEFFNRNNQSLGYIQGIKHHTKQGKMEFRTITTVELKEIERCIQQIYHCILDTPPPSHSSTSYLKRDWLSEFIGLSYYLNKLTIVLINILIQYLNDPKYQILNIK